MGRGRIMTGTLAVVAAVLFVAPGLAATPGEIAQDLQDGRLDGSYSQADLQAYLESAMAQGYGNPVATPATPGAPVAPATPAIPAGPTSGVAGVATPVVRPASTPTAAATPTAPTVGVAGAEKTISRPLAATGQVGTLPFTGVDLALLTAGGALLLLLGLGARRAGRARA